MKDKLLIIGAGSIGVRHLRNLLALGYRNLAVCDPSQEKLAKVSRLGNFGLYKDARRALEAEKPGIVFVCNPTHLHVSSASLALEAGAHVFIEKPVSHTLAGVDTLAKKAKQKRKTVMVACNFRFQSGFQALERFVRQKRFGAPLLARVAIGYYLPAARNGVFYKNTYAAHKKGGGVILDSGSHAIDYLMALFGDMRSGTAFTSPLHTLGIRSEEMAVLILQHTSGVFSSVTLDYVSREPIHRIELLTDKGTLALDMKKNILTFDDGKTKKVLHHGSRGENRMFIDEIRHFLTCAKAGLRPQQDILTARETLKTLLALSRGRVA